MAKPYGPVTLTSGQLATINTDQAPNAVVAIIINESPFTLWIDPSNGSYYVVSAFTQDKINLGDAYAGLIKVTPADDLNTAGSAPSSILYVMTYAENEPVPGMYPAGLTRLANVGNGLTQANQVIQYGQAVPTPVVEATTSAQGALNPYFGVVINNDGSGHFGGSSLLLSPPPAVNWDTAGNFYAKALLSAAPVNLISGQQETGVGGGAVFATTTTNQVAFVVNFKTVMTNQPTSLTLTVIASSSATGLGSSVQNIYGADVFWKGTSAGAITEEIVEYVTVGN